MPRVPTTAVHATVRAVLFDLDGTLVDPAGGITGGIAHALAAAGLPVPSEDRLRDLVGPPLAIGLRQVLAVPEDRIPEVIEQYRRWYAAEGMALSRPYPGIVEVLTALEREGVRLAVSTSKPQSLAQTLLRHHGLETFFLEIVGTADDELGEQAPDGSKREVVASAVSSVGAEPAECAVVGDRHYDIEAALAVGADPIGAGWGFADPGELESAGARVVVESPSGLMSALRGEVAA